MSTTVAAVDLAPVATLLLVGAALAVAPLAWVWWRAPERTPLALSRALTWTTLFLTFDLVLFGAFTRLTDSGLGCPDWPGCYGHSSPAGAATPIAAAEHAMPTGAVTHAKAWIEMTHRYLATGVGGLIAVLLVLGVVAARRGQGRRVMAVAALTLLWVCAQGAFGAWTVTMKLYPAIVTLHLLGGIGLVVLLALQADAFERRRLEVSTRLRALAWVVAALVVLQIALGGWVSTNYAVLACTDFPTCQGRWWPAMNLREGYTLLRPLGESGNGGYLPFPALTAIHMGHRLGAACLLAVLGSFAAALWRQGLEARRWARRLLALAAWQVATGLSNVVLDWPLVAAVAHTGGAAALAACMAVLLARLQPHDPGRRFPASVSANAGP
ncbi:MAG TPA: COX15/CtaA family protein [Caldimonas sp.]|nr:COX15/CtaA family protein [Caldimonas sp.]